MDAETEEVDHILSQLYEIQSRSLVLAYLDAGWITEELADELLDLFDEAGF